MKTESLVVYRPESNRELENVPLGSLVELFPEGLVLFYGKHTSLEFPQPFHTQDKNFYNFAYRDKDDSSRAVIISVLEDSVQCEEGRVLLGKHQEVHVSGDFGGQEALYFNIEENLRRNFL